ncbi:MAG: OadG family protein [Fibrobacterota bacterium]
MRTETRMSFLCLFVLCLLLTGEIAPLWAGAEIPLRGEEVQQDERIYGFEAIEENQGWSVALTGILAVFFTLIIITGIISALPVVLRGLNRLYPEDTNTDEGGSSPSEDRNIAIAIAAANHRNNNR